MARSAYALEMKGQSTTTTTYYAVESGLKLKQTTVTEMMGQTQTQDSNYGNDYKRFGRFAESHDFDECTSGPTIR